MEFKRDVYGFNYENLIKVYVDHEGIKVGLTDNNGETFVSSSITYEGLCLKNYIETKLKDYGIRRVTRIIPIDFTKSYTENYEEEIIDSSLWKLLRVYLEGIQYKENVESISYKQLELWIGISLKRIVSLDITYPLRTNSYRERELLENIRRKLIGCTRKVLNDNIKNINRED